MAVRLRTKYTAISHTPGVTHKVYELEIHDTRLETDANIEFRMRQGDARLSNDNEGEDIFQPIVTSSYTFNIMIENADHESFLSDFALAPEGRFLVRLYRNVSGGNSQTTKFLGRILHDTTNIYDVDIPVISLNVADPLTELESIDFDTYDQLRYRWKQVIIDQMLMQSKTLQYFYPNNTDEILHIYNKWKDAQHTDPTDILTRTFMQNYHREEENGQIKKKKIGFALADILRGHASRIYFEDGVYVIEQIISRLDEIISFSKYSVDQTFIGNFILNPTTIDFTNSNYEADQFPVRQFLPPLNSVVLAQTGKYIENLLFGYKFAWNFAVNGPYQISSVTQLDNQKVYCRLNINPWIRILEDAIDGISPKFGYVVFDCHIQVGNRYLKGKAGITQSYNQKLTKNITDAEWTFLSTDRVRLYMPAYTFYLNSQNNAQDIVYTFDIISPLLPVAGDVYFDFRYIGLYDDLFLSAPFDYSPHSGSLDWEANSNSISILTDIEDSNEDAGTVLTTLVNDLSNTKIYDITYGLGSHPGSTDVRRLTVNTVANDSIEWTHPDFGNMPYQDMAIHDIRSIYSTATKKLTMTMRCAKEDPGYIRMRDRLLYKGEIYIPMSYSLDTIKEVAQVIWFKLDADYTEPSGPIIVTPHIKSISSGLVGPTITTTNLQGEPSDETPDGKFYRYLPITGDEIPLPDYVAFPNPNLITHDSIRASWKVWIASTKYIFKDKAKAELDQAEFALDFTNKKILLPRSKTGRYAEIDIEDRYVVNTNNQTN